VWGGLFEGGWRESFFFSILFFMKRRIQDGPEVCTESGEKVMGEFQSEACYHLLARCGGGAGSYVLGNDRGAQAVGVVVCVCLAFLLGDPLASCAFVPA
jgi:hypothetical protein